MRFLTQIKRDHYMKGSLDLKKGITRREQWDHLVGAVLENNRNSVIAGWKQCSRIIEYNGIVVIPKMIPKVR